MPVEKSLNGQKSHVFSMYSKVNIISLGISHGQRISDCCCLSGTISKQLFFSFFRIFGTRWNRNRNSFGTASLKHRQIKKGIFIRQIRDGCLRRSLRLTVRPLRLEAMTVFPQWAIITELQLIPTGLHPHKEFTDHKGKKSVLGEKGDKKSNVFVLTKTENHN